jgi:hypothetical protein
MKPHLFFIAVSCLGCGMQEPTLAEDEPSLARSAREYFDTNVYPLLMAKCGSCHMETIAPPLGFIDGDPSTAYDSIKTTDVVGDYSVNAPVVRPGTRHFDYSSAELETILEWLRLEREAL